MKALRQSLCLATTMLFGGSLASAAQSAHIEMGKRLGVINGESVGQFSGASFNDAIALNETRLIALNAETNALVSASSDGHIESQWNNGTGSVRLGYPMGMAIDGSGRLLILDGRNSSIATFAVRDGRIASVSMSRVKDVTGVSSICATQHRVFVAGIRDQISVSKLVHVVGPEHTVLQSFADLFGDLGSPSQLMFSPGRLLCTRSSRVVVASKLYPEIRAFSEDGHQLWHSHIDGFRPITIAQPTPREVRYVYPPDSIWSEVVGLFDAAPGIVAVQVGQRRGARGGFGFVQLTTYYLSEADGAAVGQQNNIPLVRDARAGRLYAVAAREGAPVEVLPYSWIVR